MDHVTRYVVTTPAPELGPSYRKLAQPAQGRYTYATKEEAQQVCDELRKGTESTMFNRLFCGSLEPRPCACWAGHHDPVGIYFDH